MHAENVRRVLVRKNLIIQKLALLNLLDSNYLAENLSHLRQQ